MTSTAPRTPSLLLLALSLLLPTTARAQLYRDASAPVEERVADLLARMTLEEKFWQLYMSPGSLDDPDDRYPAGAFGLQIEVAEGEGVEEVGAAEAARLHAERINAIQRYFVEETRLGIPMIAFDEALHGLTRDGATAFPQALGLAATFDTALVGGVARAIAAETRSRGVRQALSPVVNLADDARWGRVEETYGEDPYLSAEMGVAFMRAFETAGVITTPKHFVANVGEGGRDSNAIERSERRLRERDFPPFRAAFERGRARSLMTAYNSVDGVPATQNAWLLTEIVREEWGFEGFVISDAAATGGATVLHRTEPNTPTAAAHAWRSGLDVVFQSTRAQHRPYLAAVTDGLVSEAVLDRAVGRVLRAKFELGLFEEPYADPNEAARLNASPEHRALARRAAAASAVLLTNPEGTLPLRSGIERLAVIGVDAAEVRLGGYSGPGNDPVSIVDGLRAALPAAALTYRPGPGREVTEHVVVPADALSRGGEPGLRGEYFDAIDLSGAPLVERTDASIDFRWTFNRPAPGLRTDWYSVRWTGTLTAPEGGVRRLGVEGNDGYRLWVDDALVLDRWEETSYDTRLAPVDLAPGSRHSIRLEYRETNGGARVRLVWDAGVERDRELRRTRIAEAVRAAEEAEVAVVVAGIEEGEFQDRASLALPGLQEELIRAVAGTGTPTVVVLVAGSPVTMPWLDEVDAVLLAGYGGDEAGHGVADVLTGRVSPAGRLPLTFPIAEGQLPLRYNPKPSGRADYYRDLTGLPLFPFGHGLTYTRFEYSGLEISPETIGAEGAATVSLTVRNVGPRASDEVVQLYLSDEVASVARPTSELRGFRRIHLAPGASTRVTFTLDRSDLVLLDEELREVVEPGRFRVAVGASSRDLRLRGTLVVAPPR
ncbi:MAG: glycoside hydrolase family 3 N-terminal domain-containing protein [Longimicrobiales bacterium]|nr:glycoside hydrolase family 3 N-terminal domain-containing protein [Longimicrobiales bacterium]